MNQNEPIYISSGDEVSDNNDSVYDGEVESPYYDDGFDEGRGDIPMTLHDQFAILRSRGYAAPSAEWLGAYDSGQRIGHNHSQINVVPHQAVAASEQERRMLETAIYESQISLTETLGNVEVGVDDIDMVSTLISRQLALPEHLHERNCAICQDPLEEQSPHDGRTTMDTPIDNQNKVTIIKQPTEDLEHRAGPRHGGVRELVCGDAFHDDCIRPWLKRSVKCPTCRSDLTTHKIGEDVMAKKVEELVSMGFDNEKSRRAVEETNGHIQRAVELLTSEPDQTAEPQQQQRKGSRPDDRSPAGEEFTKVARTQSTQSPGSRISTEQRSWAQLASGSINRARRDGDAMVQDTPNSTPVKSTRAPDSVTPEAAASSSSGTEVQEQIDVLTALGFTRDQCITALDLCNFDIESAAILLQTGGVG
eukprot:Clim_evm13s251 gene=Clim_evmTU13s251